MKQHDCLNVKRPSHVCEYYDQRASRRRIMCEECSNGSRALPKTEKNRKIPGMADHLAQFFLGLALWAHLEA